MGIKQAFIQRVVRDLTWGRIRTKYYTQNWFGHKLIVPTNLINLLNYPQNSWEPQSLRYFREHIQQGQTVVDVGACFGLYTTLFSKLVGPDGIVYAFEPDPNIFHLLKHNTAGLHNVLLFNCALADTHGVFPFFVTTVGMSSLQPMMGLREQIFVDVRRLDSFNIQRVDWMKIDTEGTEHMVLDGAEETIGRHAPGLLIEFLPAFGNADLLLQRLEGWNIQGLDRNILCTKGGR